MNAKMFTWHIFITFIINDLYSYYKKQPYVQYVYVNKERI